MKYSYICLPLIAAAFIAGCGDDEAAPQPAAAAGKTAAASVAADRAGAAGAEQAAKVKGSQRTPDGSACSQSLFLLASRPQELRATPAESP